MASSEKQLDLALEAKLTASDEFVAWILSRTRFAGEAAKIVITRSNWPWGKAKLRVWNEEVGAYEQIERDGETDLLVVFQSKRRGRFALHIENKLSNGVFTTLQPEVYRARASSWAGKSKYGDYEEWETVLVAPRSFYLNNEYQSRKFDRYISHEDIADHVPQFRGNLVDG